MTVAWALWLGGTISTFVFAWIFFHNPENAFPQAASAMFIAFGKYELYLAGVSILACGLLLISFPSRPMPLLLLTLIFAGGMAITTTLGFTPLMESLRAQGKTNTEAFARLHKKSAIAMTGQAGMLLLSGAILILTLGRPALPQPRR